MADSYVCSGAEMRCTFGTSTARLVVLPDRTVWLAGQRMANIMDHKSMANIPGFGRCRTVTYPPTGSATAAAHGKLTPMPCVPGTLTPWMPGKPDYLVQGPPALLKSCKCMCQWGGVISITDDGQHGEGTTYVQKQQAGSFEKRTANSEQPTANSQQRTANSEDGTQAAPSTSQLAAERRKTAEDFYRQYAPERIQEANAIDFDTDVEVLDLPAGTKVYMYCAINADGTPILGKYTMPADAISNPGQVGIMGYTGDGDARSIQSRQLCELTLTEPMRVLRSTAQKYNGDNHDYKQNVADTWSVRFGDKEKHKGALTEGGGIQQFMPTLDANRVQCRILSDHEAAKLYK
ncbi:MAG: DUF4280 domain-containing protein [Muribaculaceae bacterium]|nr:DUF4280 domain-containing protein [Muribaculaceae bacterium]